MIKLKNLTKKFGATDIYINTNYTFKENTLTCFYGPSGSGKSTLLNLIAGFDTDFDGEIEVNETNLKGLNINQLSKYRFQNIGFVFQEYNLLKGYTAVENVIMGIHLNSELLVEEKTEKAIKLLSDLGLEKQVNQKIDTLSGGQKQRVSIARALINDATIVLADEPTGALDEKSTNEIMTILKEISATKTVIVITHDDEVVDFADEVIELQDENIVVKKEYSQALIKTENKQQTTINAPKLQRKTAFVLSLKNSKIHFFKYFMAAFVVALGVAAFVGSLSTQTITNKMIEDFEEKNFFYNIGQVKIDKTEGKSAEDVFGTINANPDVENVYYQYSLENIGISYNDNSVNIAQKVPTSIASETIAYGDMPRESTGEVAISASIANTLVKNITDILGKDITLTYQDSKGQEFSVVVKVCGITNSVFQDFIISSDNEKEIYSNLLYASENAKIISYTVKDFDSIGVVTQQLEDGGIYALTRTEEVKVFKDSFISLLTLFEILSYIILGIGMLISSVLIYKIAIERRKEIGILAGLGYTKKNIKSIFRGEQMCFSVLAIVMSFCLLLFVNVFYKIQFGHGISTEPLHLIILCLLNPFLVWGVASLINLKIINTPVVRL